MVVLVEYRMSQGICNMSKYLLLHRRILFCLIDNNRYCFFERIYAHITVLTLKVIVCIYFLK